MDQITQQFIDNLEYRNGELFKLGKTEPIGHYDKSTKYKRIRIKSKMYLLHRVIFYKQYGWLPKFIDHINRDKLDNRLENLRVVVHKGQNTINSEIRSDNTSGYKGVTWHKNVKKWHCSVFKQGKRHYVGIFNCVHEAGRAYNKKATELFGEFAVLNQVGELN